MYLNIHYRLHNSPTIVPLLNQIRQVVTPSNFLKILCNIINPSTPAALKCNLSLRFSNQNPVCTSSLFHMYYISPAFRTFLFDDPNIMWLRVQIVKSLMCSHPVFCYRVLLSPDRFPKDLILNTDYVLPSVYQTESHTHKKQLAKLY